MDGMPRAAAQLSAAATERLLILERVLALVPRSRGFRVDADGTINVYAGTPTRASRHTSASQARGSVRHQRSRGVNDEELPSSRTQQTQK